MTVRNSVGERNSAPTGYEPEPEERRDELEREPDERDEPDPDERDDVEREDVDRARLPAGFARAAVLLVLAAAGRAAALPISSTSSRVRFWVLEAPSAVAWNVRSRALLIASTTSCVPPVSAFFDFLSFFAMARVYA